MCYLGLEILVENVLVNEVLKKNVLGLCFVERVFLGLFSFCESQKLLESGIIIGFLESCGSVFKGWIWFE